MLLEEKSCVIVCAGELEGAVIERRPGELLIAADAGIRYLEEAGMEPDLIVGDFDSLGYTPESGNVIYHRPEKDDTDTMLAVREGFERGFRSFRIYAGLGGRLDHSVANLQTLAFIAENGGRGYLVGGRSVSTVIKDSSIAFCGGRSGMISVFCQGGDAEYELEDAVLTASVPLGVSNEFTGREALISVRSGRLLVVWQQDNAAETK